MPDGALRIGRKSGNDLVLADEKTSGVHAEIVLEGDRHVLRDLGSTNGTFIDGKRVTEVVLSVGDVVTCGRLRIKFREEGDAGKDADFAMHRLDAGRVRKGGGSLMVLGLLLVAGAGGYLWWSSRGEAETGGGRTSRQKPVMSVSGNKLAATVAGCEDDGAWTLAAHGIAFQPTGSAHTGRGALEAVRIEGNPTDFAIASPAEPLTVFSGRSLAIAAHVRTAGAALAGVRAVFSNSKDPAALRFRSGTALQSSPEWQCVEVQLGVPPGCDQLELELVAVLPDGDAMAWVDDVAVTEAGSAESLDHQMEEGGQTVVGTGTALAARSTEVTLVGIAPGTVAPALAALHAADLCVLSDVGASLQVSPGERSVELAADGVSDLRFVFPADSAGGVLARAAPDGPFEAVAAEARHEGVELLLGNRSSRALLRVADPVAWQGRLGGGLYRVRCAAPTVELVLGFRAARQRGLELLRVARTANGGGEPGRALDALLQLQREAPQDSEVLEQASALRSEILARLDDAIAELRSEYSEARFFDTRGGFERVVRGVDRLHELYGENNMQDRSAAAALREQASDRLAALDAAEQEALRERFENLGTAFSEAGQPGLAKLVQDYVERHLGN